MTSKIHVGVIFGGTNTEHEVSLLSAHGILKNIDRQRYDISLIKITKDNHWITLPSTDKLTIEDLTNATAKSIGEGTSIEKALLNTAVDIFFPVLHGPFGEDGTVQGMLELMHLPYVGCGVASSAICMDKIFQKDVCIAYGIPTVPFFWLTRFDWEDKKSVTLENLRIKFSSSYPLFVKPANQGSSVGVSKVRDQIELIKAIEFAFTYDEKVLVEVGVSDVREIECSVLGNDEVEVSVLGEIIPGNEFYDYNAKYLDNNSTPIIPAKLTPELTKKLTQTARLAFQILGCRGLARVDFLINAITGEYFLSELNTMPGFTPISMYPKLWEYSGLSYTNLLTRLIELGLANNKKREKLKLELFDH